MRIDPGAWAIGFTGCFADWLITRQWRRIVFGFIPMMAAASVAGLVALGSRLDRDKLAERYAALADEEVKAWEDAWAPGKNNASLADGSKAVLVSASSSKSSPAQSETGENAAAAEPDSRPSIPQFADTLFRRVQQLRMGDQRSAFFIAMTLLTRGSTQLAIARLDALAPLDREGYLPAHAVLSEILLGSAIDRKNLAAVKHHSRAALRFSRAHPELLAKISALFWETGDRDTAVEALTLAAERDPKFHLLLAKLTAQSSKWKLQHEQALAKGEAHFRQQLNATAADVEARARLAETHILKRDLDAAEKLILEGLELKDDPILRRKLSDIYLVRFMASSEISESAWRGEIELLDRAYRIDPANEKVLEEVAKLARIGGKGPNEELEAQLRKMLAAGKATSVMHMWTAEYYLVRGNLASAVPHLESAVKRDPRAARCWNNLAYCLATLYPDRLDEALACADNAIQLIANVAEFHDTRGTVLVAMDRHKDAIDEFEQAVELVARQPHLNPPNAGYHDRLAVSYAALGDEAMSAEHRRFAKTWRQSLAASADKGTPEAASAPQP
ncbi:MAG: hypothetical protein ACTHOU_13880 [Aureliella sp.]